MLLQHFTEACACCIFHAPYKNLMHSSSLCNLWWWVYPFWFAHIICTWSGMLHWQFIEYSNHTNVSNQCGWDALFCRPNMLGGLGRVLVPKSLISVGMFPVASWDIRCPLFWPPSSLLSVLSPCSVDLLYPVWLICKNSISWHKITDNSPALQQINEHQHAYLLHQTDTCYHYYFVTESLHHTMQWPLYSVFFSPNGYFTHIVWFRSTEGHKKLEFKEAILRLLLRFIESCEKEAVVWCH